RRWYTRLTFIFASLPQQRALTCMMRTPAGRFQFAVSKCLPGPTAWCRWVRQRAIVAALAWVEAWLCAVGAATAGAAAVRARPDAAVARAREILARRIVLPAVLDRKSTRLNSSHVKSSYAV